MKLPSLATILIVAFVLTGCKNEQKDAAEQISTSKAAKQSTDGQVTTSDRLYWAGTYTGTTPCPKPCKGEKKEMTVNADSTYTLSVQAIGQEEKPRFFSGTFYFDAATKVITLDANGDHHKFEVQKDAIKELDKFGDPKQLGRQEDYILKKQ